MLREAVLPTPPFLVSAEAEVRAGNLSIVTDHLESLIARSPRRLADYLEEARASYAGRLHLLLNSPLPLRVPRPTAIFAGRNRPYVPLFRCLGLGVSR